MAGFAFSRVPKNVPKVSTKNRLIQTAIPTPGTKELIENLEKYEPRSMHGQLPIIWDKAKDAYVFDRAGNKWIDFTSTIFVTNIGHSNDHLIKAIRKQLDKELLHTYAYINEERIRFHQKLIEMSPPSLEKAFLMSAGTEATEAAVKLMSMHGQKVGKKKLGIISLKGNWHGRTMGAQLLSSNETQKAWITLEKTNNSYIPFPYEWDLKGKDPVQFLKDSLTELESSGVNLSTDICGVMLETFQGWGACFYPPTYVQEFERQCRKYGWLLCFDEMQAGFARTGKMFGFEHYEVAPDLICVGKGMGSGLPISGVLGRKEILDLPEVGDMSSTHSANPIVCAAGLATLEEIESKKLVDRSNDLGELFHARLNALKDKYPQHISRVYGRGLLAAIHFHKDGVAEKLFPSYVSERCMQKGLLVVHTGRESIKMAPPLCIERDALIEGVDTFAEAIAEIASEHP